MTQKSEERHNLARTMKVRGGARRAQKQDFSIVAIGASAGGVEAFSDLLSHLPSDTGMAFVFIQHLDPIHHRALAELLSRKTGMRVLEVSDSMPTEPNCVYVIPPNATMSISERALHLSPRDPSPGQHMSVDHFMRTLAEQEGNRAIGVILSGSGSDGALGMAEIQGHGGMTFALDKASAKYDGMPRSAVAAGCVDYVLSPKGIAGELARIARHPYLTGDHKRAESSEVAPHPSAGLGTIFELLHKSSGVDFTHYRHSMSLRRIQRRMVLHRIQELDEYVQYVKSDPEEARLLYRDMLINVTSFFRNPRVFEALKSTVFPAVLKNRQPQRGIRIWTPGCASGEETYSIAIALLEFLGDTAFHVPIQFFGTDVSEPSILKARNGVYPENIQVDVSAERLRRFFTEVEGGYRIGKSIRDRCIFAQHNILNAPPFSRMDLICCRNLLIYLEALLQSKVISLFQYALRPGGFLVLGNSEGVGTVSSLFAVEDRASKIFSKKGAAVPQMASFFPDAPGEHNELRSVGMPAKLPDSTRNHTEAEKEFDRRLLTQYAPAAVFVNEEMEIIHTRGEVDRYLKVAPGRASLSPLKMVSEGLAIELRNAIRRAKKDGAAAGKRDVRIKRESGGGSRTGDWTQSVSFEVIPVTLGKPRGLYFMIVFQEGLAESPHKPVRRTAPRGEETEASFGRLAKLEQELAATKEYLQSIIETQEATNEELQSANEEILSSHEELQSTNEELETAKEELQSANEELAMVNDELRIRNLEMTHVNNDLTNLVSSTDIALIMVGADFSIRRFTPKAQKFLGFIPGDIGRPITDINPIVEIADFKPVVQQVMSGLRSVERELTDRAGSHYQFKILPYHTTEGTVDGVVITIVDIGREKSGAQAEGAA